MQALPENSGPPETLAQSQPSGQPMNAPVKPPPLPTEQLGVTEPDEIWGLQRAKNGGRKLPDGRVRWDFTILRRVSNSPHA